MHQSFYQILERKVRATTVLQALQRHYQHPRVLYEDWQSTIPVQDVVQAFHSHHHFLGYILFGSIGTIVYTIMLGSLQVSASFYGATTFAADTDGVIVVMVLNAYLLIVSLLSTYRYCKHKEWTLPRQGTLAGVLPLVLHSKRLADDMKSVQSKLSVKDKIADLEDKGARYGLGRFKVGNNQYDGIERHHDDRGVITRIIC